jgi:hypothetical protein
MASADHNHVSPTRELLEVVKQLRPVWLPGLIVLVALLVGITLIGW